jgi:hypothetical protein
MLFRCIPCRFTSVFSTSASEIIPGVWISGYRSAQNINFLKTHHINVILNCTRTVEFIQGLDPTPIQDANVEQFRIPVDDSLLEKDMILMETHLHTIVPILIKKYRDEKKNILIHCKQGKQRSCIVLAAFLRTLLDQHGGEYNFISNINNSEKITFDNIKKFILSKRPQAFMYGLRVNFQSSYYGYYNTLSSRVV